MATPSLGDLRYLFYGGGSAAEYAALLELSNAGINVNDILAGTLSPASAMIPSSVIYTLDRDAGAAAGQTLVSGQIALTYFVAPLSIPAVSSMSYRTGATGAATVTTIRYALYSVAANGDLTIMASCANLITLLNNTNQTYSQTFAVDATLGTGLTCSIVKGQTYAAGLLCVATTPPAVVGAGTLRDTSWTTDAPRLSGARSVTALESPILNTNIIAATRRLQCKIG